MSFEFRAAVRALLLPVAPAREEEYFAAIEARLDQIGIVDDKPSWLSVQLRRWEADGRPSNALKSVVRDLLFTNDREPPTFVFENLAGPNGDTYRNAADGLASRFFNLHANLVEQHLLTHDEARQIISHAGMIIRLAIEERMTASEISRLAAARDNRFALNWRVVRAILQVARCAPTLARERAELIFASDTEAEPVLLGDLALLDSIQRIGQIAKELGCVGDFSAWLEDVFVNDLHPPYLLLLHYQLLVQAEYDHAVTYAYEFAPRGQLGDWLTQCYIDHGIPVAKSAFLNNAKATLRFDQVWVSGRADHLRSATALSNILGALENLGALAKDELASQIRGLLHRYMRVEHERNQGAIPHLIPALADAQVRDLVTAIGVGNTGTTGILEQRLVDCWGFALHPAADGWSQRGLGDSVFAANTFRKKFGDIEFEKADRDNPHIAAFESHGGRLTEPYVLDHIDSFRSVLAARIQDLNSIAPLPGWSFVVTFVAHAFDEGLPEALQVDDIELELRYRTFAECAAELVAEGREDLLRELLIQKLNEGFVHPNVRQTALALSGA